ncbi:Ig domain-containing protein [Candidatus Bipolaricaulota bacterium]
MRNTRLGSILSLAALAMCTSWLGAYATDYANIVVTYDNEDVEQYTFTGCVNYSGSHGGAAIYPHWAASGPFMGTFGSVEFEFYFGSDVTCCEEGEYVVYRVFRDEQGAFVHLYVVGKSRYTYSDPAKCTTPPDCDWYVVGLDVGPGGYIEGPDPEGRTPVSITGGQLTSGTPCNSCPPVLSGTPPPEAPPEVSYAFTPLLDSGCGPTAFSVQNQPSWASFNTSSGTLSGTPECSDCSTYTGITITATDQNGENDQLSFTVAVSGMPTITDCPDDIMLVVPKDGSRIVTWTEPSASSPCLTSFTSDFASGNVFLLGETTVTYTATTLCDVATCSFAVTVAANPADINQDGTVDHLDARICLQMALGIFDGPEEWRASADVDNDGDVDRDDARILAEYVIGIRATLP